MIRLHYLWCSSFVYFKKLVSLVIFWGTRIRKFISVTASTRFGLNIYQRVPYFTSSCISTALVFWAACCFDGKEFDSDGFWSCLVGYDNLNGHRWRGIVAPLLSATTRRSHLAASPNAAKSFGCVVLVSWQPYLKNRYWLSLDCAWLTDDLMTDIVDMTNALLRDGQDRNCDW